MMENEDMELEHACVKSEVRNLHGCNRAAADKITYYAWSRVYWLVRDRVDFLVWDRAGFLIKRELVRANE